MEKSELAGTRPIWVYPELKPILSDWLGQVHLDWDSFSDTLLITSNSGIQDDLSKQGIEIEGFGSKIAALDARVNEVFEQMKSLLAESQEQTWFSLVVSERALIG